MPPTADRNGQRIGRTVAAVTLEPDPQPTTVGVSARRDHRLSRAPHRMLEETGTRWHAT